MEKLTEWMNVANSAEDDRGELFVMGVGDRSDQYNFCCPPEWGEGGVLRLLHGLLHSGGLKYREYSLDIERSVLAFLTHLSKQPDMDQTPHVTDYTKEMIGERDHGRDKEQDLALTHIPKI
jgi:hypothetical protein